jgi:phosphotransferase system enzyme I (PtsI)
MEILLTAKKKIPNVTNKIIVTNNLSPYELLDLKKQNPKGLISATGSISSHVAIVAKNINLPSIVGVKNATSLIRENDDVIIDSTLNSILINTDKNIKSFYIKKIKTFHTNVKKLEKIKRKKTLTLDKKRIYLRGTIDSPSEINKISNLNPDGIGLFRTEFLYEDANFSNTEKNHYRNYLSIAKKFKNKKVTFRTFDMGFDKNLNTKVDSPMGLRAVRYSLKDKEFFEIQIKSLLLVSLKFNINILVPFITSVQEVIEVRKIIKKIQNEISGKEKLKFKFKFGVMIEIPSTLFILEELSKLVDFFSIGTNDLIQFTLAADRNNADLNEIYNPSHPAILKILQFLSLKSKKLNIPMSICGEITNNIEFLKLLITYGFNDFSVSFSNFLSIKNSVLNLNFKTLVAEYKKSNRYKISPLN